MPGLFLMEDVDAMDEQNRFELDFLLRRNEVPTVATVTLLGNSYELRNVNVVEDFLIVLGTVDRFVEFHETEIGAELATRAREAAAQLLKVRDEAHRCIRLLVPAMPLELLLEHFPTAGEAQKVFWHLVSLANKHASDPLKKNCDGANTPKPQIPLKSAGRADASTRTTRVQQRASEATTG